MTSMRAFDTPASQQAFRTHSADPSECRTGQFYIAHGRGQAAAGRIARFLSGVNSKEKQPYRFASSAGFDATGRVAAGRRVAGQP